MTLASAAPRSKTVGGARRTSLGALALSGSSALRLSLQLALLPILARLIGPAEYGLVALAAPFVLFAGVLSDGGMSYALGRRREVSRETESTAFWLAAGIGLTLTLLCCGAAWPMGAILRQPRLPMLIVALSPILLMNGLTAASNGRIIRDGRFASFAIGDLMSTGAGAAVALTAALNGFGAWSLVAQQLALWTVKLAWVSFAGGARVGFWFNLEDARELLSFGLHTIGALMADFVSRNIDNLIIGAVLGATTLGYYAMAYQVVRTPDMLISGPFYLYIFTAISKAANDGAPGAAQDLAAAALRLGSAFLAPLFAGLALIADLAVPLVLGDKWLGAIAPLRWLAGAGFFFCLCSIMATTLMGLGRSALQFRLSLGLGAATIVAVGLMAQFGLTIVSAALVASTAATCALYMHFLGRGLGTSRRKLATALGPAVAGTGAMTAALLALRAALPSLPAPLALAVDVAAGALVYAGVIWPTGGRRLVADARAFAHAQSDQPEAATAPT